MNKLELKRILCHYLAHDLIAYDEEQESKTDKIVGIFHNTLDFENLSPLNNNIDHYKYVMRPLSDLTKPCLEGGKIPIVELAKMAKFKVNPCHCNWDVVEFHAKSHDYSFHFDHTDDFQWFYGYIQGNYKLVLNSVVNQLQLFEKLFEWHFDVYGLIEQGLAIDINNL